MSVVWPILLPLSKYISNPLHSSFVSFVVCGSYESFNFLFILQTKDLATGKNRQGKETKDAKQRVKELLANDKLRFFNLVSFTFSKIHSNGSSLHQERKTKFVFCCCGR
jgi:hypothetical protein